MRTGGQHRPRLGYVRIKHREANPLTYLRFSLGCEQLGQGQNENMVEYFLLVSPIYSLLTLLVS